MTEHVRLLQVRLLRLAREAAMARDDMAQSYDGANGHRDFAASFNACLAAVRERVAAGGPGWEPK